MAVLPNYQSNTDIPLGFGGPLLNRLQHPGVLEDVSRGAFGGNFLQPHIVADLNSRVASGEITQDQANAHWAQMREAEAEAARGGETSARQFQQRGLTTIGSAALGGGIAGFIPAARGAIGNPGATGNIGNAGGNGMPTYGTNMPVFPGSSGSSGLFDNLLGTVGNLSPALLAGYLGNSQRQDVMGQVGRLNDVAGSLSGPAFMQSITNPYDLQTGQGRTALSQSLQQRGVGGSSFGNQQLGNYDYQRGLGRGDLATRAGTAVAGTQGQLYSDALRGIVGGNAAYNNLLGAGLGASGSLFNQGGTNPLAGLIGGAGGVGGMGGSLSNYLSGLFGTGTDNTPIGVDPYGGNPGGQVDFGNAPSLGVPDSTSGNGLFDWLNQNGAGGDLGLNF